MSIKTLTLLFLAFLSVTAFAQVSQKTAYEASTSGSDSESKITINVKTDESFYVFLKHGGKDSSINRVTVSYNAQAPLIIKTPLDSTYFTISNISSIALKVELRPSDTTHASRYYTIIFLNAISNDSLRNSNLFIGALIKTLAGAKVDNELVDLFLKLNYGKHKRFFSLIGADAGIGTNDTASGLFRINEAIANVNWAMYRKNPHPLPKKPAYKQLIKASPTTSLSNEQIVTNNEIKKENQITGKDYLAQKDSIRKKNTDYFDANLKRTFFAGAGLKIFHEIPYVGAHIGSIEINGALFGSYIFVGYYYSLYERLVKTNDPENYQTYRHNIYIEAAINAFGTQVPTLLRSMKLKFGLMLPIRGPGDEAHPEKIDVISRLAIEVPLGTVFRF